MDTSVPVSGTVQVGIARGEDDGREIVSGDSAGVVHLGLGHADLRHAFRHAFRFSLDIPPGARIKPGACIQFKASHDRGPAHTPPSGICNGLIQIEDSDDAAALDPNQANPITGRRYLPTVVKWQIDRDWTAGDRTEAQRTPDLSRLLQAIVDRLGFRRGNHVLFMAWASSSSAVERTMATFDHPTHGGAAGAPTLNAEWELRAVSHPPFALAGFGGKVTGGAGASSHHTFGVTNTTDDVATAGSLRWAVAQANAVRPEETPKVISIEVEGVIKVASVVNLSANNVTVTGRNAPGLWCLTAAMPPEATAWQNYLFGVDGNNVLIEHCRFYRGTPSSGANGGAVRLGGANIAMRFCSIAFGNDENVTVWNGQDITFQYCMIFWPLNHNTHNEGTGPEAHGFCTIIGKKSGTHNASVTWDKCIMAHDQGDRMMRTQQSHVEVKNCLFFNWKTFRASNWTFAKQQSVPINGNVESCIFMQGANHSTSAPLGIFRSSDSAHKNKFHVSRDTIWQRRDGTRTSEFNCVGGGLGPEGATTPVDLGVPLGKEVQLISTADGGAELWAHMEPLVGAHLPVRSWLDAKLLEDFGPSIKGTVLDRPIIDSVFRANDYNTVANGGHASADHTTAPLADYDDGRGWQEALTGP